MTTQTVLRPYRVDGETDGVMIDRPPAEDDMLREMTELLRDARPGMLSGLTVPAVILGVALEWALLPINLHAGLWTVLRFGLLAALAVTVIGAGVCAVRADRPLLDELGELRREIGAPVDPNVPWRPMLNRTAVFEVPGWDRVRAIVAAAHYYNFRSHRAKMCASFAIICFFMWTVVTLVAG